MGLIFSNGYAGDIRLGDTIDIKFSVQDATTALATLGGTPVISAYPDNGAVELTAGITLTVDFDARTGLCNVRVVATGANGYATATNYTLVVTTGTISTLTAIGLTVGSFSIEKRLLAPSAINAAAFAAGAIDAAAIANGAIDAATFAAGAIDNAAFNVTETLTANPAAGGIVAASFGAGAIDAAAIAADAIGASELAAGAVDEIVNAVWDETTAEARVAATYGQLFKDNVNATISSRSSHTAADVWASVTRLLTAGTNIVLAKGVGVTGFTDLSAAQVNTEVVDALNVDTYAEPAQGTPAATTTLVNKIAFLYKYLRNRVTVTATTISVFNDDALTVDHKSTHSDDATTYDRGEFITGP